MTSAEWVGIGIIAVAIVALVTSRLGFVVGLIALVGALFTGKFSVFLVGYVVLMVVIFLSKIIPNSPIDSDKVEKEQEDLRLRNEQLRQMRERNDRMNRYYNYWK